MKSKSLMTRTLTRGVTGYGTTVFADPNQYPSVALCVISLVRKFPQAKGCDRIKVQLFPKSHSEGTTVRFKRSDWADTVLWTCGKSRPTSHLLMTTELALKRLLKVPQRIYEYKVVVTPIG